jgi:hypothetical protein
VWYVHSTGETSKEEFEFQMSLKNERTLRHKLKAFAQTNELHA